jgi:hypothetical protein
LALSTSLPTTRLFQRCSCPRPSPSGILYQARCAGPRDGRAGDRR